MESVHIERFDLEIKFGNEIFPGTTKIPKHPSWYGKKMVFLLFIYKMISSTFSKALQSMLAFTNDCYRPLVKAYFSIHLFNSKMLMSTIINECQPSPARPCTHPKVSCDLTIRIVLCCISSHWSFINFICYNFRKLSQRNLYAQSSYVFRVYLCLWFGNCTFCI